MSVQKIFDCTFTDAVDSADFACRKLSAFDEFQNRERVKLKQLCRAVYRVDFVMHLHNSSKSKTNFQMFNLFNTYISN